ncbi:MAG: PhzF family phenazine biosynthesis protein [Chloroflexi bacterium]|nr:PhzF family phenazine biosynthesis protein [Chloroflexota bacterium]
MSMTIYQVDAFTDKPFAGNPAGVCLLSAPQEDRWMQAVAAEMNLSETAFLRPEQDGYRLRWFTPKVEVDLCGHATLASAHTLWETGALLPNQQARFYTRSGLLTAALNPSWIELNFPAQPVSASVPMQALADALGVQPKYAGSNGVDYLVELDNEKTVRQLEPDFEALNRLPSRGIIVTSPAETPGFDFVSRFFAPAVGINEDPVTGSAHTCLTPYWTARLGKEQLMGFQASARGGVLKVRMDGSRVIIAGQAVTILKAELIS